MSQQRYFINSIKADAGIFARALREHWGVENKLHWCLDVTFREDESRIRKGNAPDVLMRLPCCLLSEYSRLLTNTLKSHNALII